MTKIKIINDPVYGFIDIPIDILDLVDHPYFQRLRRIKQGGFSNLVYPGATHTRFHHAIGAYHLASKTVRVLRRKGIDISPEEQEALQLALLLHDIGHGPYSHSLEGRLIPVAHEQITTWFFQSLNRQLNGRLELAMSMFHNEYHRPFFHQLISSEVDLDRMDYLARDSFFSGVSEGVIGYERIIHMFQVVDENLAVEEKGLHSIEKFLLARRLMYAQVYHHKTVVSAEAMLGIFMERLRERLAEQGGNSAIPIIDFLLKEKALSPDERLQAFSQLDDSDVVLLLKAYMNSDDAVLMRVANGLLHRKVFKMFTGNIKEVRYFVEHHRLHSVSIPQRMVSIGSIRDEGNDEKHADIRIVMKDGRVKTYAQLMEVKENRQTIQYVCYPAEVLSGQ